MSDLVLSTEKSLHRPITITIDGKEYQSKPFLKPLIDEIIKYQEQGLSGAADAPYEQVHAVFGVDKKILYKIDI